MDAKTRVVRRVFEPSTLYSDTVDIEGMCPHCAEKITMHDVCYGNKEKCKNCGKIIEYDGTKLQGAK